MYYMKDPWNPTQEEIKRWAYDTGPISEEEKNMQDWELAVYGIKNIDLIISLVLDKECPKRKIFLGCLYVFVGDVIRREQKEEWDELEAILSKASHLKDTDIIDWVNRSKDLLAQPEKYEYKYWGLFSAYVYERHLKHD